MTDEQLIAAKRAVKENPNDFWARESYLSLLKRAGKTPEAFEEIMNKTYLDLCEIVRQHASKLDPFPTVDLYLGPLDVLDRNGFQFNDGKDTTRSYVIFEDGTIKKSLNTYGSALDTITAKPLEGTDYVLIAPLAMRKIDSELLLRQRMQQESAEPYDPYDHGDAFHC